MRSIKNFQDGSNRSLVKVTGILFDRHLQLNGVLTRAKRNLNKEPKMGLAQQQQQQQRGLSYRQAADELMRWKCGLHIYVLWHTSAVERENPSGIVASAAAAVAQISLSLFPLFAL